jgi:hypothetical protein
MPVNDSRDTCVPRTTALDVVVVALAAAVTGCAVVAVVDVVPTVVDVDGAGVVVVVDGAAVVVDVVVVVTVEAQADASTSACPVGDTLGAAFPAKRSAIHVDMSLNDGPMTPAWLWPG